MNDIARELGAGCLTDKQKQLLRDVWKLGNYLADPFGEWQDDLAAVIETGEMISYQLDQAFPFLTGENTDELNNDELDSKNLR
jgi:hypothetical protein